MDPIHQHERDSEGPGRLRWRGLYSKRDTPLAGLVEWQNLGLSDARILVHHPDLTAADLEAAWSYYRQHAEEIDQAIRRDEES